MGLSANTNLEADYIIVGAGAVGMAIADTLIAESDCSVIMVDRRAKPGGHWNDAYPFVRLHGPSANYGVNSRHLGGDRIETDGLNRGLYELATGSEICTYFDEVMRHELMPSGRMQYLPMHDYHSDGTATALIGGGKRTLKARRKVIDATVAETQVPSRTPPSFPVDPDVCFMPPNGLVHIDQTSRRFVVVGAGKTAIDTVIWLLENGADPDCIMWIRPRDAWLLNRRTIQPTYEFFDETYGWLTANMEAAAAARTVDDIFLHLERAGCMFRIDTERLPSMYRCAIVSEHELEQLRRVTDVVRMGHVRSISRQKLVLDGGELSVPEDTVFINCSADGIPRKQPQPIFRPGRIVPQYVRMCSPTFSGALVAKVELLFDNDGEKNALTNPAPIPDVPADWIQIELSQAMNRFAWEQHEKIREWLATSRLDQFTMMALRAVTEGDSSTLQLLERYRQAIRPAVENMTAMVGAS
jgi:hypothetical protein